MKKLFAVSVMVPALAAAIVAGPVFARTFPHNGSGGTAPADPSVTVTNSNYAAVTNVVGSVAATGGNTADTGTVASSTGGGSSVNVNVGGGILTGAATSGASVLTVANGNLTLGTSSAPSSTSSSSVSNANTAYVMNMVGAVAKTGGNSANASAAASAGGGFGSSRFGRGNASSTATNSGIGASIVTGNAQAGTNVQNYLNVSITRL